VDLELPPDPPPAPASPPKPDISTGRALAIVALVSMLIAWTIGATGWGWALSIERQHSDVARSVGILRWSARFALLCNLVAIIFGIPGITMTGGSRWRVAAITTLTMAIVGLMGVALLFLAADLFQSCSGCR
jgi:hypothetical protein